jgi:hypothetical protein
MCLWEHAMEMVVIYNMGRDAAREGAERVAPGAVDYPIVSKYQPFHYQRCNLSDYAKRQWLSGYDSMVADLQRWAA